MSIFDIASKHVITLRLPYPPTINNYYGYNRRTGKKFIKQEGREYRLRVIEILRQGLPNRESTVDKLSVWIEAQCPDRRVRDLDNLNKALLDAISHSKVVWTDDFNIDDLRIVRGPVTKGGCVLVHIRKIICDDS